MLVAESVVTVTVPEKNEKNLLQSHFVNDEIEGVNVCKIYLHCWPRTRVNEKCQAHIGHDFYRLCLNMT